MLHELFGSRKVMLIILNNNLYLRNMLNFLKFISYIINFPFINLRTNQQDDYYQLSSNSTFDDIRSIPFIQKTVQNII